MNWVNNITALLFTILSWQRVDLFVSAHVVCKIQHSNAVPQLSNSWSIGITLYSSLFHIPTDSPLLGAWNSLTLLNDLFQFLGCGTWYKSFPTKDTLHISWNIFIKSEHYNILRHKLIWSRFVNFVSWEIRYGWLVIISYHYLCIEVNCWLLIQIQIILSVPLFFVCLFHPRVCHQIVLFSLIRDL